MNEGKGLFKRVVTSTAVVAGIVLLCKLLGFAEKVFLGAVYGDEAEKYQMDIYLAVITVVVLFYDIMRYSLIPALLPTLSRLHEEGREEEGWKLASTFFNVMIPALGILVVVVLVRPDLLVKLLFPKLPGGHATPEQKMTLAATLLRIMFGGGVALIGGGITYAVLNSYKRFAAPAMGDLVFKVVGITPLVAIALYFAKTQPEWTAHSGIKAVAVGIMAGCIMLFLIQVFALRGKIHLYSPRIDLAQPEALGVLSSAAPLLVYAVFYFGRRVLDIYFASQMPEGSYSGLDFSYRLIEFPFRFVIEPLGYVVFPFFATLALKEDRSELTETVMTAVRALVLLLAPMSVGLFLLREPVVRLLFEHGKFANVEMTVAPLRWYTLGIIAFGLDVILMRAYFSVRNVKVPVAAEGATFFVNLAMILLLRNSMHNAGIACAFTIARTFKVVVLLALMRRFVGPFDTARNVGFILRAAVALAALGVVVWVGRDWTAAHFGMHEKMGKLLIAAIPTAAGGTVYVAMIALLGVREIRELMNMAKRRKR